MAPLMSMPGEIRNNIYHCVLDNEEPLLLAKIWPASSWQKPTIMPILCVNKQIHTEVMAIITMHRFVTWGNGKETEAMLEKTRYNFDYVDRIPTTAINAALRVKKLNFIFTKDTWCADSNDRSELRFRLALESTLVLKSKNFSEPVPRSQCFTDLSYALAQHDTPSEIKFSIDNQSGPVDNAPVDKSRQLKLSGRDVLLVLALTKKRKLLKGAQPDFADLISEGGKDVIDLFSSEGTGDFHSKVLMMEQEINEMEGLPPWPRELIQTDSTVSSYDFRLGIHHFMG
ncbi:MAG: hypothetical protein M1820_007002 [Bogoriella megaspora]|nr:MAG: hypothetical protein M1820_007002 [Bogoriella megaspora]